jgi:hypothetical protein
MPSPQPPIQITAWIIWFAILNGLVIIQFIIGGGFPSGINDGDPPALQQYLPAAPAFLALVVRFLVIPRISTPQKKLPVMIVGLALAEATGLLGIFLVDKAYGSTQLTFFVLSVLAILTMAPVYLKNNPNPNPFTH